MCQQAAKRRRSQAKMNYKHLAKLGRPHYSKPESGTIHQAIARERQKAARIAAASMKK